MKRIIGLTIAFMLSLGMSGIGTWAYFSDVETATGNTMAAGTLDLKTDDADGVTQTLFATKMAPGDIKVSENITLKNSGSIAGASLDLAFSYIENDSSPNPIDRNADDTAANIAVTALNYGGEDLLSSVSDNNSNGYKDVEDLKNADLSGQDGIEPSGTKNFGITVKLKEETGNDFQADGIDITMTFILNQ
jgi:predicted ribosomally synthesized peptide with SipW-like signal peptide